MSYDNCLYLQRCDGSTCTLRQVSVCGALDLDKYTRCVVCTDTIASFRHDGGLLADCFRVHTSYRQLQLLGVRSLRYTLSVNTLIVSDRRRLRVPSTT